jgi:hypothetical protein
VSVFKLPTSPLVARAWLAQVPGITAAMTATSVPRVGKDSLPAWVATGLLTVQVVGGSPDAEMAIAQPVVSVKCWAVNASQDAQTGQVVVQNKPPWGRSEQLAELVRAASYPMQRDGSKKLVTLPVAGYYQATVQSAYMLTEPRPLQDPSKYACHQFDLQMFWVAQVSD